MNAECLVGIKGGLQRADISSPVRDSCRRSSATAKAMRKGSRRRRHFGGDLSGQRVDAGAENIPDDERRSSPGPMTFKLSALLTCIIRLC